MVLDNIMRVKKVVSEENNSILSPEKVKLLTGIMAKSNEKESMFMILLIKKLSIYRRGYEKHLLKVQKRISGS